jgi:hypothetical protein
LICIYVGQRYLAMYFRCGLARAEILNLYAASLRSSVKSSFRDVYQRGGYVVYSL